MDSQSRRFDPFDKSAGVLYGSVGVVLLAAAGLILGNLHAEVAVGSGCLVGAVGLYLTVAGAVARGVQMSRR